ncbi:chain length determinant protein [Streptomyces sp. V4-01]|uniref:Chain length determinant protein n=1 Tax=Actinacidiphila polyblastidii TaxID=3110430 RepID=A0ABU7PG21_9ACTN|nr:chain length determinant protein [Streptomyces sp. V4-01]
MDLAEIVRIMRRRWYVLLPGLLLTVALTAGAYVKVPVTYKSQSTVVLLNSQKATVAFNGNPFLSTQLSLNGMADSLARNLNSDAAIAHLRSEGVSCPTEAKIADNALGPLMWLTATGSDKDAVLSADRLLTSYAAVRLRQFQDDQAVTSQAMIRMATIVPPQNPVAQNKTRYEYLVLAALMGIVVSMVATFYVDARLRAPGGRGTRRRTSGGRGEPEQAAAAPGVEPASGTAGAAAQGAGAHAQRSSAPARHTPSWSSSGGRTPGRRGSGGRTPDGSAADGTPLDTAVSDVWAADERGSDAPPSVPGSGSSPDHDPAATDTEATGSEAHRFV